MESIKGHWIPVGDRLPKEHTKVDWIAPGGVEVSGGTLIGKLWFLPGPSPMYVYYTPTYWRPSVGVTK